MSLRIVGLYYDQNCPQDSERRITDGFVFHMNFGMYATAIYQYCLHPIVFHITAHNADLCEVPTECIVEAHIHHHEKLALWLLYVGLYQTSQMYSDASRYSVVRTTLRDSERVGGFKGI